MCGVCPDHWCFQEMQRPRPLILLEPKLCFESCLYGGTWNSWWLVGYVSNFQASSKERYESISLLIWTLYVNDASMQLILLPIHRLSTAHSKHPSSHPWFSTELSVSTVPRYSPLMLTETHSSQVIVQLLQSPWVTLFVICFDIFHLVLGVLLSLASSSVPIVNLHLSDCNL